jgi:hypothetical protein
MNRRRFVLILIVTALLSGLYAIQPEECRGFGPSFPSYCKD